MVIGKENFLSDLGSERVNPKNEEVGALFIGQTEE